MPARFDHGAPHTRAFLAPAVALVERFETVDLVRKIQADREVISETRVRGLSKQRLRLIENQIDRRNFHSHVTEAKQQAVFLQQTGITKRRELERLFRRGVQPATHVLALGQFRLAWIVRIEQIIPAFDERTLPTVGHTAIDEESTP